MSKANDPDGELREWPIAETVYLTLDFECDYGTALSKNRYEAVKHVGQLVEILERLEIPVTCFVQTELLTEAPETVEKLRNSAVETSFHPHSHTHAPRTETSVSREINRSAEEYQAFFDREPAGYRFPNGNVRPTDYQHLSDAGYDFDASVFPSWRPGHFNNVRAATQPEYLPTFDLLEIPFTVYSPLLRVPTALSYCRVLGKPFIYPLVNSPPPVIVFNIHMHDLIRPPAYEELPVQYRLLYNRNTDGMALLERVLGRFRDHGKSFALLGTVYNQLQRGEQHA
ncbi:polysaccharide deacetylase family protein [Haloarcula sp. GH36]|uniref:polysaccharide deacetylase family protein n=1 Tax=Haloarcula montana TaxID=3111776 RepID=UPI002D79E999|nr:polysaccharide deacetylase family protein [Haloarcula sp. GH36]